MALDKLAAFVRPSGVVSDGCERQRPLRGRPPGCWGGLGLLLAMAMVANPGQGQRRLVPVSLSFEGPPGCSDRTSLVRRIRARVALEEEPARPGLREIQVSLGMVAGGARGQLLIREPDGSETRRQVSAPDCEEAADALALIVALTLDPDAATRTPRELPCQPGAPGCPAPPAPSVAASAAPPTPDRVESVPSASSLRAGFGARGMLLSGVGPEVSWGAGLTAQVRFEGESVLVPALRVGFAFFPDRGFPTQAGEVGLEWLAGTVLLCPLAIRGSGFELAPCLGVELGQLRARGSAPRNPREDSSLWLAGAATLEGAWVLADPLRLELSLGLGVPPARHLYRIAGEQVYATAPLGLRGAVGVGLLW